MNQVTQKGLTEDGYAFTDEDFEMISNLAHSEFGLFLPAPKKTLVYSRLARRVRDLKLDDFKAYCDLLEDERNLNERRILLSSLTTNVTSFFREAHHFDFLAKSVFPDLIAAARAKLPVRIWSAGCSTGQEPYSIAFALLDAFPDVASFDLKILGTDIDANVLKTAELGLYSEEDAETIPSKSKDRYLNRIDGGYQVKDSVKALVNFAEQNLVADWSLRSKYHLIMCRNVSIYFDRSAQATLWKRFSDQIRPGGHLLIGHSERLSGDASNTFRNVGVTAYERVQKQ